MGKQRSKTLFWHRNPYDLEQTQDIFLEKVKENLLHHFQNCDRYRVLLERKGWNIDRINKLQSLAEIPFLPTLYFKHHKLQSLPYEKMMTTATSSGTSGNKSVIGYDLRSLWNAFGMVIQIGKWHKLWSWKPCHYIVLGYEHKGFGWGSRKVEEKVAAKTAYGFTFFAPALSRTYALKQVNGEYKLNLDEIKEKLIKYSKGKAPVRIMGFPFHAQWLLEGMKKEGIRCPLPRGSIMAFGGGWKQYYTQKADKETMYALIKEALGISEENCYEFFGAVEHPILYTSCKKHHFHVPIYSRVLIRDVDTFEPVENGTMGIVNLITPMIQSAPVHSIITDDLGILHDAQECGCGIQAPYLEIIGRVGVDDITTCAAGAEKLLKSMLEETT